LTPHPRPLISLTNVGQEASLDTVNLYDAKTNLSSLVERAANGEEIIIAKAGRPLARLVPLAHRTTPREFGFLAGQVIVGPDFDDPLPEDIQAAFEGRSP
jgi:prevent-host-death family protein